MDAALTPSDLLPQGFAGRRGLGRRRKAASRGWGLLAAPHPGTAGRGGLSDLQVGGEESPALGEGGLQLARRPAEAASGPALVEPTPLRVSLVFVEQQGVHQWAVAVLDQLPDEF